MLKDYAVQSAQRERWKQSLCKGEPSVTFAGVYTVPSLNHLHPFLACLDHSYMLLSCDSLSLSAQGMSETFSTLHNLVHKGVKVVMDIPYELWNETSAEVADLKKQVCEIYRSR